MNRHVRLGPVIFRDPVLLCGVLYVLLWFDASGFLRLGLCAAFCMRTRGQAMTPGQKALLAAAGPAVNLLLAGVWALKLEQRATVRGSAFWAANVLTGAFNLLPIPPLDGAQLAELLLYRLRLKIRDCNSDRNQVQ